MITGIAHICLSVSDLEKMEKFYVEKLGLAHAFDFVNEDGRRYGMYLQVGNRNFIELFEGRSKDIATVNPSFKHFCLEVNDIQSMVEKLRSRGVDVTDPMLGSDNAWQAWVTDPEGNAIELHCYTPESRQAAYL